MGTSLSGVKIKDTYQGLIKTTDNAAASSSSKQLTDGLGNDLGVEVNTSGQLKATTLVKSGGTSSEILLADGTVATTLASSYLAADSVGNTQLADASVKAAELSTTNSAIDNYILSYDSSTQGFTWVAQNTPDGGLIVSNEGDNRVITSSGTGTGNAEANLTFNGTSLIAGGDGSSGGVTVTDGQIDIRTGTGSVAKMKFYCESSNAHAQTLQAQPHSAASSAVLTLPSATGTLIGTGDSNTILGSMLGAEFTASQALTSASAITVNTNLADVFTLTLGHSATLNFTNVAIGDLKSIIITGGGGSYTVTLGTINTASATYNRISGTYSDTSSAKNLLQIKFISTTEAWYSYSQIAS